ncbi:MAG TPA: hypothetical protein DEB06_07425, partial [Phycisphaerales bacterium]|nr:hypothetical protein [Phycisphaerales bacterium]
NFKSELEFCARAGKIYYIYVHGFGAEVGEFAMLVREVRDLANDPIACCDTQLCVQTNIFTIPAGAVNENEACANDNTIRINNGCTFPNPAQSGPFPFSGEYATFPPAGTASFGSLRSSLQTRDSDWYLARNQPVNTRMFLDYSAQFEFPAAAIVAALSGNNWSTCAGITLFGSYNNTLSFFGARLDRKRHVETINTRDDLGVLGNNIWGLRLLNNVTIGAGHPCGSNDEYWVRINYVLAQSDCPWSAPFGLAMGTFDDEATAGTFDGTGGTNGFTAGEPCDSTLTGIHRGKAGCGQNANPALIQPGDYILYTPNTPMLGRTDSIAGGPTAGRDVDYYRFELLTRSAVTVEVDSGFPIAGNITEATCFPEQIGYNTVASTGRCGARRLHATDIIILEPGEYDFVCFNADAFALGGGNLFGNFLCSEPAFSTYLLTINAEPLPVCTPTGGTVQAKETSEGCPIQFFPADTCSPLNDGCAQGAYGADPIASGGSVRGTLFSTYEPFPDDTFRVDLDAYEFTLTQTSKVNFSAIANGPVRLQLQDSGVNGANCAADVGLTVRAIAAIDAADCPAVMGPQGVAYLPAGTYTINVAPGSVEFGLASSDLDCNLGSELTYVMTMTATPVGCCTVGGDEIIATSVECSNLAGSFSATPCANEYAVVAPRGVGCSPFASISGTGTRIDGGNSGTAIKVLGDEDVLTVAIGFSFKFFGESYTQVGVSSNGFLVLGSEDNSALARVFPNTAAPNAVIAPFWSNWNVFGHTGKDFSVYTQTSGGVGNGVLTVEWNVGLDFETFVDTASFQVLLHENGGDIEFRYGPFTSLPGSFDDVGEQFSIGIEDKTGLRGLNIPIDPNFLSGGVSCYRIAAQAPFVCCVGNADGNNVVDFDDITTILSNWLEGNGPSSPNQDGDANCDGDVDFDDITDVIARWLLPCP